jgi:hypothetical protein
MKTYLDLLPPPEAYNDFVTWAALENSLKGLRDKLEEELARSTQEPIERIVVEMSSQTDIVSSPALYHNFLSYILTL